MPSGFCLTTEAFQQWARQEKLRDPAGERGAVGEFSTELRTQLVEAYAEMGRRSGDREASVAVRSSAIDEDGRFASFAGQYETYLNLQAADEVVDAVLKCWRSTEAERVTEYRQRYGLSLEEIEMAVLVQHLVPADSSAVIFSAHPASHDRSQVVINASWGLGESIVGGTVTPDTFVVDKQSMAVVESVVSEKHQMTVMVAGGTKEVPVPRFLRSQPTLSDEQLQNMTQLVLSRRQDGLARRLGERLQS